MRKEIEAMNGDEKTKAWKAYAELLTNLEIGKYDRDPRTEHSFHKSS